MGGRRRGRRRERIRVEDYMKVYTVFVIGPKMSLPEIMDAVGE